MKGFFLSAIHFLLHQMVALLAPIGLVWGALIVLTALLWRRRIETGNTGSASFITHTKSPTPS